MHTSICASNLCKFVRVLNYTEVILRKIQVAKFVSRRSSLYGTICRMHGRKKRTYLVQWTVYSVTKITFFSSFTGKNRHSRQSPATVQILCNGLYSIFRRDGGASFCSSAESDTAFFWRERFKIGFTTLKKKICEPKVSRLLPNVCDFQKENSRVWL